MSDNSRGAGIRRATIAAAVTVCLLMAVYRATLIFRTPEHSGILLSHRSLVAIASIGLLASGCAWLAGCFVCWTLIHLGWKLRRRIAFGLTAYLLVVILIAFGVKQLLDLDSLRLSSSIADPRVALTNPLVSLLIGAVALLLIPFIRRVVEASLTANSEHDKFIAAAETNANAFFVLESVRNPFGQITDFRFSYANEKAEKLMERKRADLVNRRLCQVLPFLRSNGTFGQLVTVVRTGLPHLGELATTDSRGRQHSHSLQVVKMADGVAVVMFDLSEERFKQKRMEELHRFSQSIIENAPFSIIATDAHGTILAVNAATEQLTMFRKRELVGHHSVVLLHDPVELSSRSVALAEELGRPVPAGFEALIAMLIEQKNDEREWTYVRKDNTRTPVQLSLTPLRGPAQEVTGYLAIAFDISERKKLTDSVRFLAHHDILTGMPNRALLKERMHEAIQRAERNGKKLAVMMVDVDNFKRINDSLGHLAGDEVLITAAERIVSAVRRTDTVARMGGDEFVVMLEDLSADSADADALRCATKVLDGLDEEIAVADHQVNITASIGVCMFPQHGAESTTLLRNADAAMYQAKERGRNGIAVYSGVDESAASGGALKMEQELRRAAEAGQMELYYQSQLNCRTGEAVGVEALLRWNHPTRGLLPPGEFIGTAEDTGLVVSIGEWAMRQACMEIKALQEKLGRRLTVAVNISATQFRQRNLADVVQDALSSSGLHPEDLELEITERTLMVNSAETIAQLNRIRHLGVRVAVDDFGTGFSSFKYLLEYRVDCLKIDRSFISKCPVDGSAMAIVRSIIAMAHGLNLRVVAEGVETNEQMTFLLRRHCDEVQGFLFSKPMPVSRIADHLRHRHEVMGHMDISARDGERLLVNTPQ
jgi:diguanylate cyclase (GGDEF)-like protein/PAS domain S-box-containing protein